MSKYQWTDVFISHSSADAEYATEIVRLLKETIDFRGGLVVCTSTLGYDLEIGTPFERHLREAIFRSEVVIALVSKSSLQSLFCAFELGAAWGLETPIKPILLPSRSRLAVGRPLSSLHMLKWRNELEWIKLVAEVARLTKSKVQAPAEQVAAACRLISRHGSAA